VSPTIRRCVGWSATERWSLTSLRRDLPRPREGGRWLKGARAPRVEMRIGIGDLQLKAREPSLRPIKNRFGQIDRFAEMCNRSKIRHGRMTFERAERCDAVQQRAHSDL
jgi:hypothetical protein